jgi:hypothetical protein
MGDQSPRVSDFLNELIGDEVLMGQWERRGDRGRMLRERGFSGIALAALESGNIPQVRDLVQQELGGDVVVFAWIK